MSSNHINSFSAIILLGEIDEWSTIKYAGEGRTKFSVEECASPNNCFCNVSVSTNRRYRVQCKSNAFLRGAVCM